MKSTVKVHTAGTPRNGKQQCTDCHTVIGRDGHFWAPGVFIRSRHGWGMGVIDVSEAIKLPACKSGKIPLQQPPDSCAGLMRQRLIEAEGRG